ncbi:Flp pilus assembly complex ATPase component TadA [bacterium]|nr:Flp pilus assembly complex ATPase component TadA [bacterium]
MQIEVQQKIDFIFKQQKDNFKYDWKRELQMQDDLVVKRIESEFHGYGPLDQLINNLEVTEILVNSYQDIYFESNGQLFKYDDHFFSEETYAAVLDRLYQGCGSCLNREKPYLEAQLKNLRISIVSGELSRGNAILSIRKQPLSSWTLEKFKQCDFLTEHQRSLIQSILYNQKNFLVVGNTSSGKTSLLQALLSEIPESERAVIIEDTQELNPPNTLGISLLTRFDPNQSVVNVTMDDLLKRALRLRPDRLVVGEIRGSEARSLLLALSTGHDGSFGTLHAKSAQEALLRLEMLIQMDTTWNLDSIRKLIFLSLNYILVTEKKDGIRKLKGIYEINSLESSGFTITQIDDL